MEIVQAEADIANRELSVISAKNNIEASRLALTRALNIDKDTAIETVDESDVLVKAPPMEEAVAIALKNRTDYLKAVITFNHAAEKILNVRPDEVLNASFGEIFLANQENDDFNQTILDAIYESKVTHNSIVNFNTGERIASLSVTTSFLESDENGKRERIAVIVVINDITEMDRLRKVEQSLTEELKQKHKELQSSYINLEDANKNQEALLKKVQVILITITIVTILLFLGAGIYTWRVANISPGPVQPVSATGIGGKIYPVTPQTLTDSITIHGNLKPIKVINITAPFSAAIADKLFHYGETVKQNEPLIRLDTTEILLKFRDAQAAYIKASNRLKELENWKDSDEIAKARRSLSRAKMELESQKRVFRETESLFKKGIVPAAEYDTARQQQINTEMNYESAEQEFRATEARAKGENYTIAKLEMENARTKFQELEQQLRHSTIYAPVAGTIILPDSSDKDKKTKLVEKGVTFSQGDIVLAIGDTDGISVTADLDEVEALRVRKGMEVRITGGSFAGVTLAGRVDHISSYASRSEGTKKTATF